MTDIKTIGFVTTARRNDVVNINGKLSDSELLDLYEKRSESAIEETAKQYGAYCRAISMNILHNKEDAEECVNDAYLNAWNAIPPQRPVPFSTFLGRITRNLSLDRYRTQNAKKRGGETALLLSEIEGCIPSAQNVQNEVESKDLAKIVKDCLYTLREEDKVFFIRRYYHFDSVKEIAERFSVGVSKVNTSLHRTRNKLKDYLQKRGITNEN
jgi:RNA polymerase sigma-70 factor (ECF subfamily)